MAAWHFKTKLLSINGLIAQYGDIPKHVKVIRYTKAVAIEELERRSDELPNNWESFPNQDALEMAIAELLPERESWSSQARMFGAKEKDEIEIWRSENGRLSRICLSFCLSDPNSSFIQAALNVADSFGCMYLAIQTQTVFDPSMASFVAHAEQCTAVRFIPNGRQLSELLEC